MKRRGGICPKCPFLDPPLSHPNYQKPIFVPTITCRILPMVINKINQVQLKYAPAQNIH